MKRIKKLLGQSVKIIMLLMIGGLLGVWIRFEYQKHLEAQKEDVQIIAIVNMDEGTNVNGEQINYASQIIQLPSDNFVLAGLNEAKLGIENGIYAAYIVIPTGFSEAVLSVQDNPEKIILEYAFNSKLDEEVEKQVLADINVFEITLNTNVAYVYVDAILTAFHDVQDNSTIILQNDENELLTLQGVDGDALISRMEQPEFSVVVNETGQINLTTYLERNEAALNAMKQEYHTSVQQGVAEFSNIQTEHTTVSTAIDDFFSLYQNTLDESENTNTRVLEEGRNNLEILLEVFNQSLPTDYGVMNAQITQLVEKQRSADELAANEQMKDNLQKMLKDAYRQGGNDAIQSVKTSIEDEEYTDDELRKIYEEISEEINTKADQYTKNTTIGATAITLGIVEDAKNEKINDILEEFSALFEMVDERQVVANAIQTELIDKVSEAQQGQMDNLIVEGNKLLKIMSDYEAVLANYDPFKYLDATSLRGYLSDISSNSQTMLQEVQKNNMAHLQYASSVYTTAKQELYEMQSAYRTASEQTAANVEECVEQLQSSREKINSQNTKMLLDFTTLLEYTRVGSQDNVEAYGHIVDPVVSLESGTKLINVSNEDEQNVNAVKYLFIALLLVGFVLIISSSISYIQSRTNNGAKEKVQE